MKASRKPLKKIKIVLSDLHLGSGPFLHSGERNMKESFYFDRELIELINFFSEEKYLDAPVELILNGDILDFLTVHYKERYLNFVSENLALYKLKQIIKGHSKVFEALIEFVSKPNKTITYQVGNHDADFFFPKLREHFIQHIGQGVYNDRVQFIYAEPFYEVEGRVQIHHGHQFEAMHNFNYQSPFVEDKKGRRFLNLPWGSLYVMNVVNRFKVQRDYLDKVSPISLMLFYALITDPLFLFKFVSYTTWYYIRSRLIYVPLRKVTTTTKRFFALLADEFRLMDDGEHAGRSVLKTDPEIYAVIMGHTHRPKMVSYPNKQIYLNTGSWIKTIFFDLQYFGKSNHLPFCLIEYEEDEPKPRISLFEWKGIQSPFRPFSP